jgi:hypothetical protein
MLHDHSFARTSVPEIEPCPAPEQTLTLIETYKLAPFDFTRRVVYDCFEMTSPFYSDSSAFFKEADRMISNEQPKKITLTAQQLSQEQKKDRIYRKLQPYYSKPADLEEDDRTLIFESRFESGDLKRAS